MIGDLRFVLRRIAQARENIERDPHRWYPDQLDISPRDLVPSEPLVEGGRFDPVKHPRDRRGEFRQAGHRVARGVTDAYQEPSPFADFIDPAPASPPHPNAVSRYRPAKFSPEVQALKTPAETTAYLKKLGLTDSDLSAPKDYGAPPSMDWHRQIAQAATDALAKFPLLREGKHPLSGIRVIDRDRDKAAFRLMDDQGSTDTAWAYTDLTDHSVPWPGELSAPPMDLPMEVWLNPYASGHPGGGPRLLADEWDVSDFASPATSTIYGRLMHELGHAVEGASGLGFSRLDTSHEEQSFDVAGLTLRDIHSVTPYGAANPSEGWAEVFATLNVPNALDDVRPDVRKKLETLRTQANAKAKEKLL